MSAFYRLPVEILTIIAQNVTKERKWFEEGKALRLTHPHFANLDHLNALLFHNISFHATPEGIDRLKAHPLAAVKSFVKKITFLPSAYHTGMTFFHFRRIIIKQCSWYCPADCDWIIHPKRSDGQTVTRLESEWARDPLFTSDEVYASFQEYRSQALAAQALLTDGSLRVWTDAIRQFANVKYFEYGKLKEHVRTFGMPVPLWDDPEADSDDDPPDPRPRSNVPMIPHLKESLHYGHIYAKRVCKIMANHPHDQPYFDNDDEYDIYADSYNDPYHPASVCQLNDIRAQTGLIEPVAACIHAAGVRPEKLTLSSALSTFEPGSPLPPSLQSLDLSRLRSLEWRTGVYADGTHHEAPPRERNAFMMALLHKCHATLQELRIIPDETIGPGHVADPSRLKFWPPKEAKLLPLPNLRQLHLTGSVDPRRLAPWITSMPRLEKLTLQHDAGADEEGLMNWRLALDAIRKHTSFMQVRLELRHEWLLDGSKLVVAVRTFTRSESPRTRTRSKRKVRMSYGDGWNNQFDLEKEGNSLCRWLEGVECDWDPRLDVFFPLAYGMSPAA